MARRSEYKIMLDKTKFAAPHEFNVFADEMLPTNTGDVVFGQIRETKAVGKDGQLQLVREMQTVLLLVAGTFIRIIQVNEFGAELFKESGAIQTLQ